MPPRKVKRPPTTTATSVQAWSSTLRWYLWRSKYHGIANGRSRDSAGEASVTETKGGPKGSRRWVLSNSFMDAGEAAILPAVVGFVAALIGALIGAYATNRATQTMLKARQSDLQQERELELADRRAERERELAERRAEAEKRRLRLMNALLAEIEENLDAFPDADLAVSFIHIRDMWERAKEQASYLPDEILDIARPAYAAAARLEGLLQMRRHTAYIPGIPILLDQTVEQVLLDVRVHFEEARDALKHYIRMLHPTEDVPEPYREGFGPGV